MEDKTLQKKGGKIEFLFIGLALFAMFFGAGNLIFPPDIGVRTGADWFIGFLAFLIADGGLAVLGVFAMLKADGDISKVTGVLGEKAGLILNSAIILCIGPGLAIPRTAATTFELGVAPITGIESTAKLPLAVFSVVFFAIVLVLTIRPSAVVDIIGKVLTPVLVVAILVMIVVGFINPLNGIVEIPAEHQLEVVKYGINNGYQTMDAMAALFFGIIIINSVKSKGFEGEKAVAGETIKAAVVALILLFVVYGGLAFLGATSGSTWMADVHAGNINQAGLVIAITQGLLGRGGVILLGVVVALACLTTAIALTSSAAEFFSGVTRFSYETLVVVVCVFSAVVCNLGLSTIISVAAPVLTLVYPLVVLLIFTTILRKVINKKNAPMFGCIVALVISACTVLHDNFGVTACAFAHSLPLDSYGFNWLLPTLVALVIGMIVPGKKIED